MRPCLSSKKSAGFNLNQTFRLLNMSWIYTKPATYQGSNLYENEKIFQPNNTRGKYANEMLFWRSVQQNATFCRPISSTHAYHL